MTTPTTRRKKELPTHIPREASFSLADSHRLLVREFGKESVPSIVTMKRAAASGALKTLEASRAGHTHPRYSWAKMRAHFQPRSAPAADPAPAPPGTAITQEQLAAAVAHALMPLLAPLATRLEAVEKAVGSLAGVRQTLMLKYDAAASSALNKAEMLDQQLRETKRLLDVDTQVRKLAAEVGRLTAAVANLNPGA